MLQSSASGAFLRRRGRAFRQDNCGGFFDDRVRLTIHRRLGLGEIRRRRAEAEIDEADFGLLAHDDFHVFRLVAILGDAVPDDGRKLAAERSSERRQTALRIIAALAIGVVANDEVARQRVVFRIVLISFV